MKINNKSLFRVCLLAGIILFAYFFPDIITYMFLAFIVMLIAKPITKAICLIRIGKYTIPRTISTVITLLILILILLLSLFFFVPSLIHELRVLENVNYDKLIGDLTLYLSQAQSFLHQNHILNEGKTFSGMISDWLVQWLDFNSLSGLLRRLVTSTGTFFFGLFAVFFIAFFFIKDDLRIENGLKLFFNSNYVDRLTEVVKNITSLLSRYFTGTIIKTGIMTVLLYFGFLLFGIKGAFLMALIGGITNIIPYLGPFIGWGIVCLFGLTNAIGTGIYTEILPFIIKVSITFISANAIDNIVLGPVIYSQSIKAHPVEIFIVTILGGRIAGIAGMILGIPVYTILRIAVIEIYRYLMEVKDNDSDSQLMNEMVMIDDADG